MEIEDYGVKSSFVIHPDNTIKLLFDLFAFILILFQAVILPFKLAFSYETENLTNFDYFTDIYFIVDVLLNFNTGIYNEGIIIMERNQIVKEYAKTWMVFDIFSSLPYSFIFDNIEVSNENGVSLQSDVQKAKVLRLFRLLKFIKIVRLLKMVKLKSVLNKVEEIIFSDTMNGLLLYIKVLAIFFFVGHLMACIWYTITEDEMQSNYQSFLTLKGLQIQNLEIYEKYSYCLYFIFTTFFTVGYGDFHPTTTNEQLFTMFIMITAYALFCYMVSTIRNVVQKSFDVDEELKNKLKNSKLLIKEADLPEPLTEKLVKYLEFLLNEREMKKIEEAEIFGLLNEKLGQELRLEFNKKILMNFNLFLQHEAVLAHFHDKVYEEIINPNEILVNEDESSSRLYFISKGNVLIFHKVTTVVYKELGPKDLFGELGFFRNKPRMASAITKTFCTINLILRKEFYDFLNGHPEFKLVIDELIGAELNKACEKLEISCYCCDSKEHLVMDCPDFLKQADKLFFILKENEEAYIDRLAQVEKLSALTKDDMNHFLNLRNIAAQGQRRKKGVKDRKTVRGLTAKSSH